MKQANYLTYIFPAICFFSIFYIYVSTMLPSQAFHDAGEFQVVISTMQIAHPTGFPTYIILGKIFNTFFPIGEAAFKANLLSSIYSVGTLIFLWLFLRKLTRENILTLIACLIYALVVPFWNNAGLADSHTLNRLFIFALLYIALQLNTKWNIKSWAIFCFLWGLGLGNHLLLVYAAPGMLFWIIYSLYNKKIPFNSTLIFTAIGSLMLGLSVYLLLPIIGHENMPQNATYSLRTWEGFSRHVFGGDFQGLMFQGGLLTILKNMHEGFNKLTEFVYVYGVMLGAAGLLYGLKRYTIPTISLVVSFLSLLAFSTNYPTSDPNRYYMTYVGIFCIWIGLGVIFVTKSINALYTNSPRKNVAFQIITSSAILLLPCALFINNYQKVDKSNDFSAVQYANEIFTNVPENSIIITWWNYYTPLWYNQAVLGQRQDVLILNNSDWVGSIENYIDSYPVYLVDINDDVASKYALEKEGQLYRVQRIYKNDEL